ncbi:DNA double-strand break repair RAD50 ATPase [Rhynchospora pubera]|uniref:DNA double-strand break repair RAD50 ATPase n=1 Tax=Rhynchospora pubera TaxID=906938 RepID=A0AAV8BVP9_9POAL|nr:DNA double-strand break repair RAD50 ATPase [Rhynchospora pubera]
MASSPFSDYLHDSVSTHRRRHDELIEGNREKKPQLKTPGRTTKATTKEVSAHEPHQYTEPFAPTLPPLVPQRKQKVNRRSISFADCRPSIVPFEKNSDRGSHRHSTSDTSEEWRLVATELSKKLLATARKRDDAVVEASRLKQTISELHRELASKNDVPSLVGSLSIEKFLRSVSAARSAIRMLARTLNSNVRPYVSPAVLLPHHMEALLNQIFYNGFELTDEDEMQIADPSARCKMNQSEYGSLQELNWDQVLIKGTRHYSDRLSRFCDRRMSEVVGSLGWAPRVWPEHILRAFFGAAKSAWAVRLLTRSVHPPVPIMRVDPGTSFDSRFMEDVSMDETDVAQPVTVKLLVAPGFNVYTSSSCVVKCKVLCGPKTQDGRSRNIVVDNSQRKDGK